MKGTVVSELLVAHVDLSEGGLPVSALISESMFNEPFLSSAHAFIRKEWYNVNVPSIFDNPVPTLTPVNKSAGQSK